MKSKLLLGLLAVTLLAGCDRVDPNSPLGKRQALFEEMLRTSEDLGGMLRGRLSFNEQRFAEGAAKLDELSRQPWQHFPQVRESDGDSQQAKQQFRLHIYSQSRTKGATVLPVCARPPSARLSQEFARPG